MTAPATPASGSLDVAVATGGGAGLWRDTIGNILRQRNARVGLAILVFLALAAIFADQLASYGDTDVLYGQATKSSPPCIHLLGCAASKPEHIFGVDSNIRDEFSRVVHGARVSLIVGFLTVGFAIAIGTLIGLIAGYAGGWIDNTLMRMMDVLLVFPSLLLAISI